MGFPREAPLINLCLTYEALELPGDSGQRILAYTAEAGSPSQSALDLLASWSATPAQPSNWRTTTNYQEKGFRVCRWAPERESTISLAIRPAAVAVQSPLLSGRVSLQRSH